MNLSYLLFYHLRTWIFPKSSDLPKENDTFIRLLTDMSINFLSNDSGWQRFLKFCSIYLIQLAIRRKHEPFLRLVTRCEQKPFLRLVTRREHEPFLPLVTRREHEPFLRLVTRREHEPFLCLVTRHEHEPFLRLVTRPKHRSSDRFNLQFLGHPVLTILWRLSQAKFYK